MHYPHLFSLSTGISEEDLGQLDMVTTHRGTRAAHPAPSGDPWQYYQRGREDNWGDSSMEALDTDEGRMMSGQILDTARRMATEACGEVGAAYAKITDPIPMFAASDAATADILPKEAQNEEGDQVEVTTEDSFAPFDFEEAFEARHRIKPEEADAPFERSKRSWKEETGNPDNTKDTVVKTSLATSLYLTSEILFLVLLAQDVLQGPRMLQKKDHPQPASWLHLH